MNYPRDAACFHCILIALGSVDILCLTLAPVI